MKRVAIGIAIGVAITLVVVFVSPFTIPVTETPETTKTHIYIDDKAVVGGNEQPIELINNPNATNPTYAELLAFLERDETDKFPYILGPPTNAYVCADFARDVHNNAEAAGIRAAWVGIDIEGQTEGHALNAFETTDRGLVYIDCTGKGLWDESPNRGNWDRRAYVELNQPYAVAYIDRVMTKFKFFIHVGLGADQLIGTDLGEQTLRTLEELGWLRLPTYEERSQRTQQLLEWLRTHDSPIYVKELGQKWVQEWIRQHESELYGKEFEIHGDTSDIASTYFGSEAYATQGSWWVDTEALGGSWFQPEKSYWYGTVDERVIMVDGIPVVWQVTWHMNGWRKPFRVWNGNELVSKGAVKAIHIHWGE